MNKEAIAKLLRSAFAKGFKELPKDIQRGYRRKYIRRGSESLTGALFEGPVTRMLKGKPKITKDLVRHIKKQDPKMSKKDIIRAIRKQPNIRGAKKVKSFLWNKVQKPALMADIAAGKVLNTIARTVSPAEKLFKIKEKVPVGKGVFKEIERYSALAPGTKAVAVASPFIVGMQLQEWLEKSHGQRSNKKIVQASR